MSYSYELLKWTGNPNNPVKEVEGPVELSTKTDLIRVVTEHIGMTPDWLTNLDPTDYIGVEEEEGDFILLIEGSEVEPTKRPSTPYVEPMTDSESAMMHNLLVKYCKQYAMPGEWSITERRAFTDLASDLRESISDPKFKLDYMPNIV